MSELITLPKLIEEINLHHEQAQSYAESAIEHALSCGDALLKAKEQVKHGEWLPWLQANTSVSERQSQRYMKVASNREQLELKNDTVSDLTVRSALELLAEPANDEPKPDTSFEEGCRILERLNESMKVLISYAIDYKKMATRRTGMKAARLADETTHALNALFDGEDEIRTLQPFDKVVRKWKKCGVIFTPAGLKIENDMNYSDLCELGLDIAWIDKWDDKKLGA